MWCIFIKFVVDIVIGYNIDEKNQEKDIFGL